MKRLLILIVVLSLLVVAGTLVSAEGQTRHRDIHEQIPSLEFGGLTGNY